MLLDFMCSSYVIDSSPKPGVYWVGQFNGVLNFFLRQSHSLVAVVTKI